MLDRVKTVSKNAPVEPPPFARMPSVRPNVRGLAPSVTLAINELSGRVREEGREVFRLGLGQSPFPVPDAVVEALRDHAHCNDYLPVRGLPLLREAVASYYRRISRSDRSGEHVLIGPGSKELMFLLQMVHDGDLVVPVPSWVSYAPQAGIVGRRVHWLTPGAGQSPKLDPDALEAVCRRNPDRPQILILNYPNNPTGQTYRRSELQAITRVARRHRVIVLSDEIYGELRHDGDYVSIAEDYPEGTIVSGGLSKWCGAGGWRLGTFTFPRELEWLLAAMTAVASETFTATSAPIQHAAVTAFLGGESIDRYLTLCRSVLKSLGRRCATTLTAAGVDVPAPEGGFYLFPDFGRWREPLAARGIADSSELCRRLFLETGVATVPGSHFGCPESQLTLRLAYVDFDGATALAGADRAGQHGSPDAAYLRSYCRPVLEAVDRIIDWLPDEERAPGDGG